MRRSPVISIADLSLRLRRSPEQLRLEIEEGRFLAFAIQPSDAPKRERLRIVRRSIHLKRRPGTLDEWRQLFATMEEWLLPEGRMQLKVRDVAHALACSAANVKALCDCGKLLAFSIADQSEGTSRAGHHTKPRQHLRIHRDSLCRFIRDRLEARNGSLGKETEAHLQAACKPVRTGAAISQGRC